MLNRIKDRWAWFWGGVRVGETVPGLIFLSLVALVFYLTGSIRYPLNGDEYNSIREAQQLGLNWQSLVYAGLLRGWIELGLSDAWLRLLSVLLGVGSVLLIYACASQVTVHPWNLAAGLLAATSPFLAYHAQEVRFYSLFIFSSALFLWLVMRWVQAGRPLVGLIVLVPGAILLVFSHFLGILVVTACLLFSLALTHEGKPLWRKVFLYAFGLLLLFTLPLIPAVQQGLWSIYQTIAHTTTASPVTSTSIAALSLAKMAVSGYVLMLGYHTYPMDYWLVIPAMLVMLLVIGLGVWKLIYDGRWASLLLFYAILFLGIYVVLDSVGGRLAGGVAPRHVAFLAPIVLLLAAVGLSALPGRLALLALILVLLVNLAGLVQRWRGDWVYGTLTDYRQAAAFSVNFLQPEALILHDGRSGDPIQRYFPGEFERLETWSLQTVDPHQELSAYDQLLFVSNDFQEDRRRDLDHLLREIEQEFAWTAGRVEYPLFEYVFKRKTDGSQGYPIVPGSGQVRQPLYIYGLEFQDLSLPLDLEVNGSSLEVVGAFSLPDLNGERVEGIPLAEAVRTDQLTLITTLVNASDLAQGTVIAEVSFTGTDGSITTLPIRLGEETQSWDKVCVQEAACETVYQWHKRLALLGQRAYPEAWSDFQAGLHTVSIPLPGELIVERIQLEYSNGQGALYFWAIQLEQASPQK